MDNGGDMDNSNKLKTEHTSILGKLISGMCQEDVERIELTELGLNTLEKETRELLNQIEECKWNRSDLSLYEWEFHINNNLPKNMYYFVYRKEDKERKQHG